MTPVRRNVLIALIGALIAALGVILSGVLPEIVRYHFQQSEYVPTSEDLLFLENMRGVLTENQVTNTRYADFNKAGIKGKTFEEIFSTFDLLIGRKQKLLTALPGMHPPPRYSRLYQLLKESIASGHELFTLEKQGMQEVLEYMKFMESLPKPSEEGLDEKLKRETALKFILEFRGKNKQFLQRLEENITKTKIAKANSARAIELLNNELERIGLPYKYKNVFAEPLGQSGEPKQEPKQEPEQESKPPA